MVGFFADISQRVFAHDTNFSVSAERFIAFSVCHYYSQYRCVIQQGELAQMVERLLSMQEVLGSIPTFSIH